MSEGVLVVIVALVAVIVVFMVATAGRRKAKQEQRGAGQELRARADDDRIEVQRGEHASRSRADAATEGARPAGFEPATGGLEGRCSIH